MLYLWLKAFHLISIVCWFAGLFYLPRLFVYHAMSDDAPSRERFKVMERKLLRQIMTPAMIVTFLAGGALASIPGLIDWNAGWWWTKLICVLGLAGFHGACGTWRRGFAEDRNQHPEKFYRIANEVPTILMMIIVIMIIVRP